MAAAVPEGVDAARAQFGRYSRRVAEQYSSAAAVAAAYPPTHRTWSQPADVAPNSVAERQLDLLAEFTQGACSAPEFAHEWWETRRASQASGERVEGRLEDLFDRVFMLLEDYAIDPAFAEPGDLSDADLQAAVSEVWNAFHRS
jgi:hypothetical protein